MRRITSLAFLVLALVLFSCDRDKPVSRLPDYIPDGPTKTTELMPDSCYPATAILQNGSDVNIAVVDGSAVITAPTFDPIGHATLDPLEVPCGPGPAHTVQTTGRMGWPVHFMETIARGDRPLRYCLAETRQFDLRTGRHTTAIMQQAVYDVFDAFFDIKRSVEDCNVPDLIMGANAAEDCGTDNALGCAAFRNRSDGGEAVRVTFNGRTAQDGQIRATSVHEYKHGGDLNHCGVYGQETGSHFDLYGHPCDLDAICGDHSCSNPTNQPTIFDWYACHNCNTFYWGLRAKQVNPTLPPSTPRPTPSPTPQPTPPPRIFLWPLDEPGTAQRYWQDWGWNNFYCTWYDPQNEGCWR